MELPQSYANVNLAREITRTIYPEAQNVTIVEHSHDNIVALVDNDFAVRFPRDKNSYLRSLYERHVLRKLETAAVVTIPLILDEHTEPPYVITSFVPGHHVRPADIRQFHTKLQMDFSKTVAKFAYAMHSTFSLIEEASLRKELGLDELADNEPWPIYYKKVIYEATFPTAAQDELAKKCFGDWMNVCNVTPSVVVHDDLHTENMMFENSRLVGVLDFGDTNLGTPEQELRQLYRISEAVMMAGVKEYQRLSNCQLNIEAIKLWATMKELADYSKAYAAQNTSHHSFIRASRNLNNWLPDGGWGKGYDLTKLEGCQ